MQSARRVNPSTIRPACQRFFASEHVPETHKRSFGQPTIFTHPNIMKKNEGTLFAKKCINGPLFSSKFSHSMLIVTPGLSKEEFEQRRSNLIKSMPEGSTVVSVGYSTRYMTNNIFYPFHQNTDFWYLCGFNEPDAAMILGKLKRRILVQG